jgi:hypothetical protein
MRQHGYIGRCPVTGCRHAERHADQAFGHCPDHGSYGLDALWGVTVPEIKCNARCQNAVGPSCDCSCGGENHGRSHIGGEQLDVLGGAEAIRAPNPGHEAVPLFTPAPSQIPGQLSF